MNILKVVALVTLLAAPLAARQRYGVESPETIEAGGKKLTLVGVGLRKKAFFKVYLASNYVENVSTNPGEIIAQDMVRRVELHMMRSVDKGKIVEAIREGFEKNSKQQMPKLEQRLQQFEAAIPDLREGDKLAFTYVPGAGLTVAVNGTQKTVIAGKDFADALWAVWLGPNPVDDGLKNEMLAGAGKQQ